MEQLNPGQAKRNIRQLKQRQEQYLHYLGQLAFQAGEQGVLQDPGMLEAYRVLKDIQAQITHLEAWLQQAKAAREAAQKPRCPQCGSPLQAGAAFCAACGANLAAPGPAAAPGGAPRTCAQCGFAMSADAVFCANCGARSHQAAAVRAAAEEAAPPLEETHACPRCGADMPGGAAFCATCAAAEEAAPPLEETHACPRCGADMPGGAAFCATCAAAEEAAPPLEETHACPSCGAGISDKDTVFCAACGTRVRP